MADAGFDVYIDTQTGEIYEYHDIYTDNSVGASLPDDIDTNEKYLAFPNKSQLDLNSYLVFSFAETVCPNHYDKIRKIFSRAGAYKRFRSFIERHNLLEKWYEYSEKKTEEALRGWCQASNIPLAD